MQQLESIAKSLFADLALAESAPKPVKSWNPPNRGPLDLQIKANGDWFYEGSEINRTRLIKLFASILRKEEDGGFYLVTPHEKFQVTVEDAPFIIIDAEACTINDAAQINLRTNVDDYFVLDPDHPLLMRGDRPYIKVRDELWALVERSVFYRLVEIAEQRTINGATQMVLRSANTEFPIGEPF